MSFYKTTFRLSPVFVAHSWGDCPTFTDIGNNVIQQNLTIFYVFLMKCPTFLSAMLNIWNDSFAIPRNIRISVLHFSSCIKALPKFCTCLLMASPICNLHFFLLLLTSILSVVFYSVYEVIQFSFQVTPNQVSCIS